MGVFKFCIVCSVRTKNRGEGEGYSRAWELESLSPLLEVCCNLLLFPFSLRL